MIASFTIMASQLPYLEESERLRSFKGTEDIISVHHVDLARAGFYDLKEVSKYTGERTDATRCPVCNLILRNWHRTDNPLLEHRLRSPDCPLVRSIELWHDDDFEAEEKLKKLWTWAERKESFKSVPKYIFPDEITIDMLVQAGFYYLNDPKRLDAVRCFDCRHILEHWHRTDNPILAHKLHSPDCWYICSISADNGEN